MGSLSETPEGGDLSNNMKKMAETVSELVESVEESQIKQVLKDFHPRTERENNVNRLNKTGHRDPTRILT